MCKSVCVGLRDSPGAGTRNRAVSMVPATGMSMVIISEGSSR